MLPLAPAGLGNPEARPRLAKRLLTTRFSGHSGVGGAPILV